MIELVQYGLYELYGGEYSGFVVEFNRYEDLQYVFRIVYSPYRDEQQDVGKYVYYTFEDLETYRFAEIGACKA